MAVDYDNDLFPPGEYIRDKLDARGWTQEDLGGIMGRPSAVLSKIINGTKAVTPQTAKQLAAAFGTSAELWMNLESAYRLALEQADQVEVERRAAIYAKAPVSDMVRRHWIAKCNSADALEREVLRFLGIPSLDATPQLEAAARKSGDDTTAAQIAWLCRVKQLADTLPPPPFSLARLEKHLDALHALTASEHEVRHVPAVLAKMGIRFLVVQHLPKTKIDGYTLWLNNKPVIAMSMRYDRIDGFWHTLAHEVAHVRNGDRTPLDSNLVGPGCEAPVDDVERRANQQASEWLVSTKTLESFIVRTKPRYSKRRIIQFANLHKIHPGIIVGQLQFRGEIEWRHNREMLIGVKGLLTETAVTDGWGHVL
ncbi:MAG: helix-turn-helix domain-containing protein [Planctomycetes bacterium]|nr:helix-turn-helix domain-containing protein [Planctomycetota bacterium]